jgi:hypothetical protein
MANAAALASGPRPLALGFRLRKLMRYQHLFAFYWYHKLLFKITNTKFDISFCVFVESFIHDQYGIRKFLESVPASKELTFVDVGRNHGLVFYYTMYHIMKRNMPVSVIHYYGIDPSPLKFVYFNFHDYLRKNNITIHYHILDRAVVFNNEDTVTLKYGEDNFGNFNVTGSNYDAKMAPKQDRFSYIEIIVETLDFAALKEIIRKHLNSDTMIIKIDCKNRTDYMFSQLLDMLSGEKLNYMIASEHDGSSDRDVSAYLSQDKAILTTASRG